MSGPRLLDRVGSFLVASCKARSGERVLVGASGGVDSMVLLDLLRRLGYDVVPAHINYRLRGQASDADEIHIRQYCRTHGLPLRTIAFDTKRIARDRGVSVQVAARELRYDYFEEQALELGARQVAVGHHADDQAETLLINLLRGTGIDGLAGMPPRRPISPDSTVSLIRPLLETTRAEIIAWARVNDVEWREDESNAEQDYLRNAVRSRLLPEMKAITDDEASARIARAASFLRSYRDSIFEPAMRVQFDMLARETANGGVLKTAPFVDLPSAMQTRLILEALRRWIPDATIDFATADRIAALIDAQVGRHVPVAAGGVWREREGLAFVAQTERSEMPPIDAPLREGSITLPGGRLRVERAEIPITITPHGPTRAIMDAAAFGEMIRVRRWRFGDRLQPFGMTGHKKVSDILTDACVPTTERRNALVLESGGRIMWVIGVRVAESARVTKSTRAAWSFSYEHLDQNEGQSQT